MSAEVKDEFKRVENIEELSLIAGKLVQVYFPKIGEYIMGYLKRPEEQKRIVSGIEISDITIYLADFVRRKGKSIDIGLYKRLPKHPKAYIPRVLKRKIEYVVMKEEEVEQPEFDNLS